MAGSTPTPSEGTVYEDAEDGNTDGWIIYDRSSSLAKVSNVVDSTGRVIELTGRKLDDGFMLGNIEGRSGSWNNTTDKTISWRMKYSSIYYIYIRVVTSEGPMYIIYRPTDSSPGYVDRGSSGVFIYIGLGTTTIDGNWHTITRDLAADIQTYRPGVTLKSIHAFLIRGGGRLDDIMTGSPDDGGGSTPTPDTTAPVITLSGANPMSITQGGTYTELGATATDNVDGVVTVTPSGNVNTNTVGTYTITYTATDSAGNTAQVTRTVNVVAVADTEAPIITLNGDNPITITQGGTYNEPGATATDNVDAIITITTTGTVNTDAIGTYTITYTATDNAGNTAQVIRTVNVVAAADTEAPTITLTADNPMTVTQGGTYTELGATATDNVDAVVNVTTTGTVDTNTVGTYTINYSATDSSGNTAQVTRTVNVIAAPDTEAPVITLNGNNPMTVTQGNAYAEPGATADDNVDGVVTVTTTGTVDTNTVGTYTMTYSAVDSAGNSSEVTRTVNVVAGNASLTGRVTSTTGAELQNVTVNLYQTNNPVVISSTLTGGDGSFGFLLGADQDLTLQFITDGYATQVLPIHTPASGQQVNFDIVMIARGAAQNVPASGSATLTGADGASVTVTGGSFVDGDGNPVSDNIQVTITPVDVSTPLGSQLFPGNFSGIQEGETTPSPIASYGVVEYRFTRNGEVVNLAAGATAEIEIPIYVTTHPDGTPIQVGDTIPLWYLDETTGMWQQEGTGTVVVSLQSPTGFAMRATVSHFSWWNCDVTYNPGHATITVHAPFDGTATVYAKTEVPLAWWRPQSVDTMVAINMPTRPLYIPSRQEVCFWADANIEGTISTTPEVCLTANTNEYVDVDLSLVDTDLALSVTPDEIITTEVNQPAVPTTILPSTYESSVNYNITSGRLPNGVSLKVLDNTRIRIEGVPTEVGTFPITVQGVDSENNSDTVDITYNSVVDNTPPEITLLGDNPIEVNLNAPFSDPGVIASDNKDGVITHKVVKHYYDPNELEAEGIDTSVAGIHTITYDVADAAGNQATQVTRTVEVITCEDNPIITLNGENVIDLYQGDAYNESGAIAFDCRERPIEDITIDGSVDVNLVGSYTLTYTATDPFGNHSSVTRTVNVLERPDAVPDAFSFTDVVDVEPNTLVQAGVTITGINMDSPVSIQNGEYSVDNGVTWRTTPSNVVNNTAIFVRHWSSWDYETDVSTILTVGGVSDTFTSTTRGFVDLPPVARLNESLTDIDIVHYLGAYTPYVRASGSDETGISYCQWTNENGDILVQKTFDKPVPSFEYGECEVIPEMFDTVGTYRYTFMVRDTSDQTDTIDMNVDVLANHVPVVDIGGDRSVVVGEVLNIAATATDDDADDMSYSWMYGIKGGYAMTGAGNNLDFSHQFEVEGIYVVEFTATDVHGAATTASIEVTVTSAPNQSPIAYAGMDQMVTSGTDVILDGGDSYDNDGYIASYLWEEGSTELSRDARFTKNDFSVGTHTVTLTVTDDEGDTDSDEVTITIVDSQISPVFEYQYMYQGRFEDVAVDAQGNSYAAGWRFDGCAENGQVTPQAIIVKYDSDGQMIDNWESDCTASRKLYGITLHGSDLYAVGYQQSGDPHYYENGGIGDPTQIDGYAVKFDLSSYLDTQSGNPATFANANFHQIYKSVAIYDNHLYAVGFAVDNTTMKIKAFSMDQRNHSLVGWI